MSSPQLSDERPKTLGELTRSDYKSLSVKDELRANLIAKLRSGEKLFRGIVGYDETVIPQLVNAILARHNVILLGLRGQAKSRIIRQLTELLDDQIPIIAGSEVNDDPFQPISAYGRQTIALHGEQTRIDWINRDSRFVEKLATPDVTIADIIGDVDPIKAAKGGHLLSDELTIHYGLLPRANRGIFAINELPDLAGKIQVGLFNIMQEGDVQIKGYPVRLPLDVMLVFSANPEDYTARGKIITPLKDRIGTEIVTHYPAELQTAVEITRQEAWLSRGELDRAGQRIGTVQVPEFIRELVEQIAFEARDDNRVDKHSGVSQRMPITVSESMLSNAERRALLTGEEEIVPRISDVYAAIPSMTGKMELEYEGEQVGASRIAKDLIKRAAGEIFEGYFVGMDFAQTIQWFEQGNNLRLADTASATECKTLLEAVPELLDMATIPFDFKSSDIGTLVATCEFVLEGLYAHNKISRNEEGGYTAVTKAKKDRRGMIYDDLTETGKYS
jgi:magnesium chelatase subunit I